MSAEIDYRGFVFISCVRDQQNLAKEAFHLLSFLPLNRSAAYNGRQRPSLRIALRNLGGEFQLGQHGSLDCSAWN